MAARGAKTAGASDFVAKMDKMGKAIQRKQLDMNRRAGERAAGAFEAQFARQGLRKGARMKPESKRPVRWQGIVVQKARMTGSNGAEVIVRAARPAWLWNNPTKAHWILPKSAGGSRRNYQERAGRRVGRPGAFAHAGRDKPYAMKTPAGPRYYVWRGATKGSGAWQKAKPKALDVAGRSVKDDIGSVAVAASFGKVSYVD